MAFATGTATNQNDLLDKFRNFMVNTVGWTELLYAPASGIAGGGKLSLRGPGAGVGRQVFINADTLSDVTDNYYTIRWWGAIDYTAGALPGIQPGASPMPVYTNVWDGPITYWLYGNSRRAIIVAKTSTVYVSAYLGMFLPWGTPDQYPMPLYVAGDAGYLGPWTMQWTDRRMCVDPGIGAAYNRGPNGVWHMVRNHVGGTRVDSFYGVGGNSLDCVMWPYHSGASADLDSGYGDWTGAQLSGLDFMVPTKNGDRPMWPCQITPGNEMPSGVLDGVYAIPGRNLSTESIITMGAGVTLRTFRVFQNIHRNSGNDFFAVEEI